jgi:hypothetical protein
VSTVFGFGVAFFVGLYKQYKLYGSSPVSVQCTQFALRILTVFRCALVVLCGADRLGVRERLAARLPGPFELDRPRVGVFLGVFLGEPRVLLAARLAGDVDLRGMVIGRADWNIGSAQLPVGSIGRTANVYYALNRIQTSECLSNCSPKEDTKQDRYLVHISQITTSR